MSGARRVELPSVGFREAEVASVHKMGETVKPGLWTSTRKKRVEQEVEMLHIIPNYLVMRADWRRLASR